MRTGKWLAICALLGAGACSAEPEPLTDPSVDDTDTTDDDDIGGECTPFESYTCRDGDVYAMDSCGEPHDLISECTGQSFCEVGLEGCCTPTPSSGTSSLAEDHYVVGVDVDLSAPTDRLSWELDIVDAPPDTDPEFMMYVNDFNIGAHRIWLAMGTDLGETGTHGFWMTNLSSADVAVQVAEPDGYEESDGTSNRGVRKPYPWQPGRYTLTLERGAATDGGHFFELSVVAEGDEESTFLGAIEIPDQSGAPATIASRHSQFMYIYSGRDDFADIKRLALRSRPVANEANVVAVTSRYRPYEASEARWQDGALFMSVGVGTARCTPDGSLYVAPSE